MVFGKKKRRTTSRKGSQGRSSAPHRGVSLPKIPVSALLIGIVFVVATSFVIIAGGQVMPWRFRQIPSQDIRARVAFTEPDEQATEAARETSRQSTPNYYRLNNAMLDQINQGLTNLYTDLTAVGDDYAALAESKRKRLDDRWGIDETAFALAKAQAGQMTPEQFKQVQESLRSALIAGTMIEVRPEEYRKSMTVMLMSSPNAPGHEASRWFFESNEAERTKLIAQASSLFAAPIREAVQRTLGAELKAVWAFDRAETDKQRQLRYDSADNERFREYEVGHILVRQDHMIEKRDVRLLELEHDAYWRSRTGKERVLAYTGTVAMVTLITLALGYYCVRFQFRAIHNWSRSLALMLTLFLMVLLIRLLDLSGWGGWNRYAAVFAVVLVGMVMTITYSQRFALVAVMTLILFLLVALQGDVSLLFALLAGGVAVVYTLDEIRTRSKLIEVAVGSALMSFAVVWAVHLARYQQMSYILPNAFAACLAALVACFIVQGILPVIERLFQVATSMTLLEWCDASKPLLRRMAVEAPGTFNHSLRIGSISEAAAEAIGANGLLARVGGYYHDIGKINKAEYFVENQPSLTMTRHKDLSPAMSHLVIIGHVKDGLELARQYNLPRVLHQFITEHHGSTLVEFFYHLDSQKRTEAGEQPISDVEFRYPGPKPHSKESVIVMLADSVESATRALSDPTAGRIETTVHQVAKKKLEDGQFNQSDLTLKELRLIEESLTRSLRAEYHGRIKYPSQEVEERKTPAEETTRTFKLGTGSEAVAPAAMDIEPPVETKPVEHVEPVVIENDEPVSAEAETVDMDESPEKPYPLADEDHDQTAS